MSRFKGRKIYVLTPSDVERLQCLLQSVAEAVIEIVEYRSVEPIDPRVDFPAESAVYQQTSEILKEHDSFKDLF